MKRQDIELSSRKMTEAYINMTYEMNRNTVTDTLAETQGIEQFYFIRIISLSKNWDKENKMIWETMSNLYAGLYSENIPVIFIYKSESNNLGVYIGTVLHYIEILEGILNGLFPRIKYESGSGSGTTGYKNIDGILNKNIYRFGGYLKGNPYCKENAISTHPIDSVIRGMRGKNWSVVVAAFPENKKSIMGRHEAWLVKYSDCSELLNVSYSEEYSGETVSYNKSYHQCKQFADIVEGFVEKMTSATAKGGWCVSVNYSSQSESDSRLLGALLVSSYFGEKSFPEPIHTLTNNGNNVFVPSLNNGNQALVHKNYLDAIFYPIYSTILNSDELAMLACFPTQESYGISISEYVEFDVNRDITGNLVIGNIIDSDEVTKNEYSIDVNELNRHCLIAGLTGSGKTNTIKNLVYDISTGAKIPFMVIEPAKKEYWELYKLGFDNLQIYSVGSNERNAHKLCINPFERISYKDSSGVYHRVPIQTHIDFVFAAFKASFIMYTPMPYVLERAIYEIYEDLGWDIHNDTNPNGDIYPTMEDLYFKIEDVIDANGFDEKMKRDLTGSLQARINSMRIGAKGDILNVTRSFPLDYLFSNNVIIELEDIGDDDVKAFIISILLIELLEYRRQQQDSQLEIKHLLLIEEAHRLLKNVQSGTGENADPRGAAVEFFCNLLAELRSKGQGFIVADQIPSKLAPDLIKNTNLKIVHRTVAEEERVLIGGAMHMTEEQVEYLASLKQGVAAVYSEGDNRPLLVKPLYAGEKVLVSLSNETRETVLYNVSGNCIRSDNNSLFNTLTDRQTKMCRMCNRNCSKNYKDILRIEIISTTIEQFAINNNPYKTKKCKPAEIDNLIYEYLKEKLGKDAASDVHIRLCILGNLVERWNLSRELTNKLIRYYTK